MIFVATKENLTQLDSRINTKGIGLMEIKLNQIQDYKIKTANEPIA